MSMKTLDDLFIHLLQDMYYAEGKIVKALPKMAEKATDADLQDAFERHCDETKDQITKLQKVFSILDIKEKGVKCEAIEGLLKEGKELMSEAEEGPVCDSAMIAAAQKVEHYEIASYGALCSIAKNLGHDDAAKILHSILEQEKATDEKLIKLSRDVESEALSKAA